MNTITRVIIIAVVVVAAAAALYFKEHPGDAQHNAVPIETLGDETDASSAAETTLESAMKPGVPRLVCFGAERCVPCRMMIPVREALAETYPNTLSIHFVDVWQDRSAGQRYNIRMIPTTVFVDADGKERYRQEGFLDKQTIVAKFKELGIDLEGDADETSS